MSEVVVDTNSNIPVLRSDLAFFPLQTDRSGKKKYLVEAGETCFAVDENMHDFLRAILLKPQSLTDLTELFNIQNKQNFTEGFLSDLLKKIPANLHEDAAESNQRKHAFIVKWNIVPEKLVNLITDRLTWVYSKYIAMVVVVLFILTEIVSLPRSTAVIHTPNEAGETGLILASMLLIALLHEIGHAVACKRFKCPPGPIGAGLYYFFPVLYSDVTRAWRLTSHQRSLVDVGGIYFQSIVQIVLCFLALISSADLYYKLMWLNTFVMLQNLNPVLKMDGYWLLSDLSRIPNLHNYTREVFLGTIKKHYLKILGRGYNPDNTGYEGVKWVYIYIFLVLLQTLYMLNFLVKGIYFTLTIYPHKISEMFVFAQSQSAAANQALEFLKILPASLYPIIISIVTIFIIKKFWRISSTIFSSVFERNVTKDNFSISSN